MPPAHLDIAEYELTAGDGGTAAGVARFALTAPAAGPFTLPLTGVRLEAVELDGDPVSAAAAAGGYRFELPAGPHALVARFAVPVAGGRAVRFGVPDVARCRVTVAGPPGADVASRRGVQRAEGGKLVADHGGGAAVEVRWAADAPTPAVREATVWDVAEGSSRGVFAARLTPVGGPVATVTVEVPTGVEVGSPTVRADAGPAPVVTWKRESGRVRVTLAPPADRPVWLTLPLAAVGPGLRCPAAGAAEGFAAVRGPVAEVGRAGVIDFPADGLRGFADVPELRLAAAPPARVFQRRPGQAAELTPKLAPPPAEAASAETVWTVGPTVMAAGTVRAERASAGFVAFDLPADVTLLGVRAGDAARWTRAGSRVTAWLPGPAAEPVVVTWVGTLPGGGSGERELPGAVPASSPAVVRAVPADGWAVEPLPDSPPGRLRVRVFAPAPPVASLLEVVERSADGLAYRVVVGLPLAAGRPHRFRVTVADPPAGAMPTLRTTGGRVGPGERAGGVTGWGVEADGPVTLTLAVKLTPPARLPEMGVRFDGPPLAWAGRGLVVGAGLTADGRPAPPAEREAVRAGWPGEADKGTVWAADGDERRTVAVETPPPVQAATAAAVEPPAVSRVEFRPDWLPAAGWLLAFILVAAVRPAGPERLAAVGVLGAVAVGGTVGWGFLLLAAAGVGLRLARLGAVVLR